MNNDAGEYFLKNWDENEMEQQKIKENIIQILGNLISRSIEEARKIPYQMDQDTLVDILIGNPQIYKQMVLDGLIEGEGMPRGKVVVKVDILDQMAEFEGLDQFDLTFAGMVGQGPQNSPALGQIDLLTKLFLSYLSNLISTFERSYKDFMKSYHPALPSDSDPSLPAVELSWDDLGDLRKIVKELVQSGKFIQAFSYGPLLDPDIISNKWIRFLSANHSLAGILLPDLRWDPDSCRRLCKFILRASYISQSHWQDLFVDLVHFVSRDPEKYQRDTIIRQIESDSMFCCNLLHEPFQNVIIRRPGELRKAIEKKIAAFIVLADRNHRN